MSSADTWQPLAHPEVLRQRAALLGAAREFFAARDVLEVETPTLGRYGVTDRHIASLQLREPAWWLRSSPEYHMKRLLAAGCGDIYQIGKVFRAGEAGSRHQPEFTMAEWYRLGFSLTDMISETCEFIAHLHAAAGGGLSGPFQTHSFRDACKAHTGLDPLQASINEVKDFAASLPVWSESLEAQLGSELGSWLDFVVSHAVYPCLPAGSLQVITDYPADQAMLARIRPDNPLTAERFEVLLDGVELANGFHELADANEQRDRFAADVNARSAAGLPTMEPDDWLLAALEHGLPDCCGVAVGLDRLLMLAGGYRDLQATLSFRPGC